MNIDLLLTAKGEAGFVSDAPFDSTVAAVMYDTQSGLLNLEFANMDGFELNIPVSGDYALPLSYAGTVHIGIIEDSEISESRQVPLLLLNTPKKLAAARPPGRVSSSVLAFEQFLKASATGQPVHRDNLADEATADGVMAGLNRAVLHFAPHLAHQRALEAAPRLGPTPPAPGFGPGGMSGGMGGGVRHVTGGGGSGGYTARDAGQRPWQDPDKKE